MIFRHIFILSSLVLSAVLLLAGIVWAGVNWPWLILGSLFLIGVHDLIPNKHTLLNIYPMFDNFAA